MKKTCVNIFYPYVNPFVLVMGCIFVVRPLIDNIINVATIALRQPMCFGEYAT
jgi:hypothetical protein